MRITRAILISVGWMLSAVAGSGASQGGVLAGVVVDDQGAPIPNALVLYRSVPTFVTAADGHRVATGLLVGSGVRTGADGSFAVGGLPAATHHLCAYGKRTPISAPASGGRERRGPTWHRARPCR